MLNNFSSSVKNLWIHDVMCRLCRKRPAASLHHIHKRGGTKRNKLMSSPFNSSPLCDPCHSMGSIHHAERRDILAKDTADFLKSIGYKPTKHDKEFLKHIYENNKMQIL